MGLGCLAGHRCSAELTAPKCTWNVQVRGVDIKSWCHRGVLLVLHLPVLPMTARMTPPQHADSRSQQVLQGIPPPPSTREDNNRGGRGMSEARQAQPFCSSPGPSRSLGKAPCPLRRPAPLSRGGGRRSPGAGTGRGSGPASSPRRRCPLRSSTSASRRARGGPAAGERGGAVSGQRGLWALCTCSRELAPARTHVPVDDLLPLRDEAAPVSRGQAGDRRLEDGGGGPACAGVLEELRGRAGRGGCGEAQGQLGGRGRRGEGQPSARPGTHSPPPAEEAPSAFMAAPRTGKRPGAESPWRRPRRWPIRVPLAATNQSEDSRRDVAQVN